MGLCVYSCWIPKPALANDCICNVVQMLFWLPLRALQFAAHEWQAFVCEAEPVATALHG